MENIDKISKCKNCGTQLSEGASYCHNCGQSIKEKKISIKSLFLDFFNNTFNFDFKFFKTIKTLMIPGKLTGEYFKGRYASYLSPWRLFFISIIFMLLSVSIVKYFKNNARNKNKEKIISYSTKDGLFIDKKDTVKLNMPKTIDDSGDFKDIVELNISNNNNNNNKPQKHKRINYNELLKMLPDSIVANKIDRVYIAIDTAYVYSDSILRFALDSTVYSLDNVIKEIYHDSVEVFKNTKVSKFDLKHLSLSQLKKKYNINTEDIPTAKLLMYNVVYKLKSKEFDRRKFLAFILRNINWFIIILLPFVALIFKLLYVRRKRFFVEHLVFNIHNHSAILLLITLVDIMLMFQIAAINKLAGIVLFFLPALYYIFAMKRYYGQSWFKTISKFFIFSIIYLLILSVAWIIYFFIGAWLTVV